MPIASRVLRVALAMCGVSTTCSIESSASLTAGSNSKTSSAAPAITREKARRRARAPRRWSPGGVDEERRGFHRRQGLVVDQVVCLRRQRAVEADDVGARQQLVQRIVAAGEDRARAECFREARRLPADPAGADDPDRLALEPFAEHELERERPGRASPDEPVSLDDPAQEGEGDCDGELRRRLRQDVRGVRDHDPPPPAASSSMLSTPAP